jgi:phosphoribosyl 1,2-cyclic phosphodiesterase
MATTNKRPHFFETAEGVQIEEMLRAMEVDVAFNTQSSYVADTAHFPDNVLSFMDKHKRYLLANPSVDPRSYVANLRLKTRLR